MVPKIEQLLLQDVVSSRFWDLHCLDIYSLGQAKHDSFSAWRLHPGTKKARKGNVGTSVEWRLNSENDSRLHGQPSFTGSVSNFLVFMMQDARTQAEARAPAKKIETSSSPRLKNAGRDLPLGSEK